MLLSFCFPLPPFFPPRRRLRKWFDQRVEQLAARTNSFDYFSREIYFFPLCFSGSASNVGVQLDGNVSCCVPAHGASRSCWWVEYFIFYFLDPVNSMSKSFLLLHVLFRKITVIQIFESCHNHSIQIFESCYNVKSLSWSRSVSIRVRLELLVELLIFSRSVQQTRHIFFFDVIKDPLVKRGSKRINSCCLRRYVLNSLAPVDSRRNARADMAKVQNIKGFLLNQSPPPPLSLSLGFVPSLIRR